MIYYILSTQALAESLNLKKGSFTIKQFSDQEWHVTIHDEVRDKSVRVLAQTGAPADSIIQLLLLCNALQRSGAKINLLISYFGYARQDKAEKGESLGAEVMCRLLKLCNPERIDIIHIHNPETLKNANEEGNQSNSILFHNHIPYSFFYGCSDGADVIAAPDKGAQTFARHIAEHTNKELVLCEKYRPEPEKVELRFQGDVQGKKILIVDDMITTGRTVIKAADLLHEHGAQSVSVAATHGVFAGEALKAIEESIIEKVYVTNTLNQERHSKKLSVVSISNFIAKLIA